MTHPSQNGQEAVDLAHIERYAEEADARLRAQVTELRVLLGDEDRVQAALRAKLDESRARQHGLRKAIDALAPQSKPTPRDSGGPRSSNDWTVSDAKVAQVMGLLLTQDAPITATALARKESGLSSEAVRRAFITLRQDGRIRVTGVTQGGGKLYAPMPEELEGANA